jgi:ribonuclease VapC
VIVDTSALIAIVFGEPDAERYVAALPPGQPSAISAATWFEASILAMQFSDEAAQGLRDTLDWIFPEIVPVTHDQMLIARDAYARFGKGRHKAALNFGDCFAYALAKERDEPLLFKGNDFAQTDVKQAL